MLISNNYISIIQYKLYHDMTWHLYQVVKWHDSHDIVIHVMIYPKFMQVVSFFTATKQKKQHWRCGVESSPHFAEKNWGWWFQEKHVHLCEFQWKVQKSARSCQLVSQISRNAGEIREAHAISQQIFATMGFPPLSQATDGDCRPWPKPRNDRSDRWLATIPSR